MLEAEAEQSSTSTEESLATKNARLQNKVAQLTRDKKELLKKVAHYEAYTKRLCTVLRKLKGSIDTLASQSTLIGEALSESCEAENDEQNEENVVPEQPQVQAKKKMQTASVLPMVRGFPIRRIIVPLQRLNINSHRHRPNRIHGHRREPWWRETEPEAPEQLPLQEAPLHRPVPHPRVPVRRLQRVERRPHRAVVRPRTRPGARRRQEAAVVERAGPQNRRNGSSHQMLQAVVLLQRLSLTQHQQQQQQQQQQRREQESQPMPADGLRTPVVMLRDISTSVQAGDRVSLKSEEPAAAATATAGVKTEPAEGSSVRAEGGSAVRDEARPGPSGWSRAGLPTPPPEPDMEAADAAEGGESHSGGTAAAPAEEEPCEELPPVLMPAEQGEFTVCEEQAGGEKSGEPPPPRLSPSLPCSNEEPTGAVNGEEMASEERTSSSKPILSEMETMSSSATEATADAGVSDDTSVAQSEPAHLLNGETTTLGQKEVSASEPLGVDSPASADTLSTEDDGAPPLRSPAPKKEPSDTASTPSSSRKRKASSSLDSPEKCSGSPRSDVESPHSETDQGSRPRRRCAIRKNYALFFAGWNTD